MIEQLFGSKTRVKLLQLFYGNPNRPFYVREITRKIDEQINSVRRELANLLNIGIIKSNSNNNRLYYEVDQTYGFYKPLANIFGGTALEEQVTSAVDEPDEYKSLGNVQMIILTGQFTRDETSGVDMLLVGDLNPTQVSKFVKDMEEKEGREIRYAMMNDGEFAYRQEVNDRFLSLVLDSKHQLLMDNRPKPTSARSKKAKAEATEPKPEPKEEKTEE